MYIKSIYINNFAGTFDKEVIFDRGVNIIEGENESGKSTIGAFIKFMFYGFTDKNERMRMYSWGQNTASGTLTLCHEDNKTYRIEREYAEGSGDTVQIIDLEVNAPCFEGQSPEEVFLSVPRDVFTHTAYIGQTDGGTIDGEKISRAIENILFSADENINTEKALKKLDDARVMLLYKNKKGGRIYDLLNERDKLKVRLENAKHANSGIIEKEGTLRETKEKIKECSIKTEDLREKLEYYEAAEKYRRLDRYKRLKEQARELEKLVEVLNEQYTFQGFIPDEEYINSLKAAESEIDLLNARVNELNEEINSTVAHNSDLGEMSDFIEKVNEQGGEEEIVWLFEKYKTKRRNMALCAGTLFFIGTMLAAVAAFIIVLAGDRNFGILFGGGALLLYFFAVLCLISKSHQKINENELLLEFDADSISDLMSQLEKMRFNENRLRLHNSKISDLKLKLNELHQRREEKIAYANDLAAKWNKTDIKTAVTKAQEALRILDETKKDAEKYRLACDTLKAEIGNINEEELLGKLDGRPYDEGIFSEEEIEKAKREYDFYSKAHISLVDKTHELEKELAVLNATVEQPTRLADTLSEISETIEELNKKYHSYLLAYQKLTEASAGLRESVAPRLSSMASDLIKDLTSRKYSSIGIGRKLEMQYDADSSHSRSVDFMSAGTQDLAYISLRFALIKLLYRNGIPPLVFDESFARLDDNRLSNMFALISKMADEGMQTLLFTCQKREAVLMASKLIKFKHIVLS